jgi:hypothetical protein
LSSLLVKCKEDALLWKHRLPAHFHHVANYWCTRFVICWVSPLFPLCNSSALGENYVLGAMLRPLTARRNLCYINRWGLSSPPSI